jgi:hypothetical protein
MRKFFSAVVPLCLLAFILTSPVHAQLPDTAIRVSIPFDFIVRGKTLPAGKYEITRVTDEPIDLLIRNVNDKRDHVMFETQAVEERSLPRKGMLVFHCYGDSNFLSEIVAGGEQTGRRIATSHAERALQRELASTNAEPKTITVALN